MNIASLNRTAAATALVLCALSARAQEAPPPNASDAARMVSWSTYGVTADDGANLPD